MDTIQSIGSDRVREASPDSLNRKIDQETESNVRRYSAASDSSIRNRLQELDKEWDMERLLELNASVLSLTGVILGATVSKKWLILPGIVTSFLIQHALQGWCPPMPVFRALGVRTQKEIEAERHALIDELENEKF